MKVWITKYALTQGILYRDAKRTSAKSDRICVTSPARVMAGVRWYVFKPDWHESFDDAMAQVNVMVERKLKSLWKAIDRIEALVFVDPAWSEARKQALREAREQAGSGDGRADLSGYAPGE